MPTTDSLRPHACAAQSRQSQECLAGTASRAQRWVLLEQPGAWGKNALAESSLPAEIGEHLLRLKDQVPARVVLLRRPGGRKPSSARRTMFVAHTSPTGGWLEQLELADVREMLDVDVTPLSKGLTVGGTRQTRPHYLVCTNGKHDPCCAQYGLPVARVLQAAVADRVWECSHIGGDRFAGNLVSLPDGFFYGRLDPDTARTVVAATESGQIALDYWRGRSALPFAWQAAEAAIRREFDLATPEALTFLRGTRVDDDRHQVWFVLADRRRLEVTVVEQRSDDSRALTCSGNAGRVPVFALDNWKTLPANDPQ